jgi:hypothetical protein
VLLPKPESPEKSLCYFVSSGSPPQKEKCPYIDYHNYFLLTPLRSSQVLLSPDAFFNLDKGGFSDEGIKAGVSSKILELSLNYFPQHETTGMPNENAPLEIKITSSKCYGQKQSPIEPTVSFSEPPQAFYAASEFVLWKGRDDSTAEIAFLTLVHQRHTVNGLLSNGTYDATHDSYIPVAISFFGDGRVDAALALMIRRANLKNSEDEDFIAQALMSLNETTLRQREIFLHRWRQRLRSRVSDLFHDEQNGLGKDLSAEQYKDKIRTAKKNAVKGGAEALQRMILVLLADRDIKHVKDGNSELFYKEMFELSALEEDTCSKASFNCFKGNSTIPNPHAKHQDRCAFICEFCKQAKISILEGLGAGKLKGALARDASADLMDIAKDDPVKARVLIRGEAGGGKGVAAEDFHAHCMERIAKATNVALADTLRKALKEFPVSNEFNGAVKDCAAELIKKPKVDDGKCDEQRKVVYEYFDSIHKALLGIKQLPDIGSVSKQKQKDKAWDFQKSQIVGTAWWLWGPVEEKDVLKPQYVKALDACVQKLSEDNQPEDICFANLFVTALSLKILHELINEKKWSFNFFQVNCGIMGGQNSELAESIRRLFGQTDESRAAKALPGLFQTCSYVGGTLFLDEIADAPVRIQDNLLRPLEEGKVSRPGWETITENVKNIRIAAATFKDLFKLAEQYRETLPSGNPKGFRPDLLTRLTRNPPVTITPVWHHFVPSPRFSSHALQSQFCYVMVEAFPETKLTARFWDDVYMRIKTKLDAHCTIATGHLPDEIDRRRHFASKITMRFLKALADRASTAKVKSKLDGDTVGHLDRMLDYLLCDS